MCDKEHCNRNRKLGIRAGRFWRTFVVACFVGLVVAGSAAAEERIFVNHLGYLPGESKRVVAAIGDAKRFRVINVDDGAVAFEGELRKSGGAFGRYVLGEHAGHAAPHTYAGRERPFGPCVAGDFTALDKPGVYHIQIGEQTSGPFRIGQDVYDEVIAKCTAYFSLQRCGPSKTGYHAPCHIDDGRRLDNGQHLDVTGGWHDAGDVRKWMSATIYGMTGLEAVKRLWPVTPEQDAALFEELRWGNRYFLAMQDEKGFVYDYCGGDDGNRWTDNKIGTPDDRPIHVNPAAPRVQYRWIMAQTELARLYRGNNAEYAARCLAAAVRCYDYWHEKPTGGPISLGNAVLAGLSLHATTGEERYRDFAFDCAEKLLSLQECGKGDAQDGAQPRGFFYSDPARRVPMRSTVCQGAVFLSLAELCTRFPHAKAAPNWKKALRLYACDYVLPLAQRNAFCLVPHGLYVDKDPGGGRRAGRFYVRYFMEVPRKWWVGMNSNALVHGVGLLTAARVLDEPRLRTLACRQFDWVLGCNPFSASTVDGLGRNQPARYYNKKLQAPPLIPGAVMCGIGGNGQDMPLLVPGSWQTCEYWTPHIARLMTFVAELKSDTEK